MATPRPDLENPNPRTGGSTSWRFSNKVQNWLNSLGSKKSQATTLLTNKLNGLSAAQLQRYAPDGKISIQALVALVPVIGNNTFTNWVRDAQAWNRGEQRGDRLQTGESDVNDSGITVRASLSSAESDLVLRLFSGLPEATRRSILSGTQIGPNDIRRLYKAGMRQGWLSGTDAWALWGVLGTLGLQGTQNLVDPDEWARRVSSGDNPETEDVEDDWNPSDPTGPGPGGGGRDFTAPPWDPDIWDALKAEILDALQNPGWDDDILQGALNDQRSEFAARLQGSMQDAMERMAERGISDSGLAERSYQNIEALNQEGLAGALTEINTQNARDALQRIATAMQTALGMRGLDLSAFATEIGALLDSMQIDLARELGIGDLDLRRLMMEQNWLAQILAMLGIDIFGGRGSDSADDTVNQQSFIAGDTGGLNPDSGLSKGALNTQSDLPQGSTFAAGEVDPFGTGGQVNDKWSMSQWPEEGQGNGGLSMSTGPWPANMPPPGPMGARNMTSYEAALLSSPRPQLARREPTIEELLLGRGMF